MHFVTEVGSNEYNCTSVLFCTGTDSVGTFENLYFLPIPRYFFCIVSDTLNGTFLRSWIAKIMSNVTSTLQWRQLIVCSPFGLALLDDSAAVATQSHTQASTCCCWKQCTAKRTHTKQTLYNKVFGLPALQLCFCFGFALQHNTALPSSAAIERVFSIGKDILKSNRAGLSDAHFKMILFLKVKLH